MNCPDCGGEGTVTIRKMSGMLYKHCTVDECQWEYSTSRGDDYSWVTNVMFDTALVEIVDRLETRYLLTITGVYEALSEEFNNDVLDALTKERGEEE